MSDKSQGNKWRYVRILIENKGFSQENVGFLPLEVRKFSIIYHFKADTLNNVNMVLHIY